MGVDAFRQTVTAHGLLLLDTMVFSYHLGGHPRYASLTREILAAIELGQVAGLTTTITLAELLTRPAQANDQRAIQEYELYVTHFPNLRIVPLDVELARETARVRAETGLRMPDAVQVAAARLYEADAIVTNDHRWQNRVHSPSLILLDEYV